MSKTVYVSNINTPGFLPSREPQAHDTAREAWEALLWERRDHEDDAIMDGLQDGYSADLNVMEWLVDGEWINASDCGVNVDLDTGEGSLLAPTPGGSEHDLGLVYSVEAMPA